MPTISPSWSGRHRRRVRRLGAAALILLALSVAAATLAPPLLGWTTSQTPGSTGPPGVGPVASPSLTRTTGTKVATPRPPATRAASAPATSRTPSQTEALAQEVLALTNAERAKRDCPALRAVASLRTAAQRHSAEMARRQFMTHTGQNGSDPGDRMHAAGYDTKRGWAENVAAGYRSARAVVTGWMNSSGHRANILNCGYRSIGVGVARAVDGDLYWTQDFGGS